MFSYFVISRSFFKNSLLYTLAGALPMASAVILLPVYILSLPLEMYGALSICLAISILVQVLVTLSFDISIYVHYHDAKNDRQWFAVFVSSAFNFMALAGLIVISLSLVAGPFMAAEFLEEKKITFFPYGFLAVVTGVFQSFFKVYAGLLQSRQKPELYFFSNLSSFGIIVLITVAGLHFEPANLIGPMWARAIASFTFGAWALWRIYREYGIHLNLQVLRSTFTFNASNYIYQLQQWVINYFDRILITLYLTLQDVGAYDFAFKCLLLIDLVLGGLNNSFLPKVLGIVASQENKHSTQEINRYYHGLVAVCMLLVVCAIVMAPVFFRLNLFREDYRDALLLIPLMAVVYLIKSMRYYFSFPYGSLKYSKPLPGIYLAISVIKIGLMLLLIKPFGVKAVIYSAIVSAGFELVLLRYFIQSRFAYKFNHYKLVIAPLILAVLIVICEHMIADRFVTSGIYVLFCVFVLWWLYRRELLLLKPFTLFGRNK